MVRPVFASNCRVYLRTPAVKVVIRRSPPLFVLRGERAGVRVARRFLAILLAMAAAACAYQCFQLVSADVAGADAPSSPLGRWHVWLAGALAAAGAARLAWGRRQPPTNLE